MTEEYSTRIGIAIDEIDERLRPARQTRAKLDKEAIERYRALYKSGKMPEVKLVHDPVEKTFWVVDGAHTITAAKEAKCRDVWAIVKENSSYVEAFREATRCNAEHGVPIREADKKHAILEFLKRPEADDMKDGEIAEICNVSRSWVQEVRCAGSAGTGKTSARTDGVHFTPKEQQVVDFLAANPEATYKQITEATGISHNTIRIARRKLNEGATPASEDEAPEADDIPFIAESHWEPVVKMLGDAMREWPRSHWGKFTILCSEWVALVRREIGMKEIPDPSESNGSASVPCWFRHHNGGILTDEVT